MFSFDHNYVDPMLKMLGYNADTLKMFSRRWSSVEDVGPTSTKHWSTFYDWPLPSIPRPPGCLVPSTPQMPIRVCPYLALVVESSIQSNRDNVHWKKYLKKLKGISKVHKTRLDVYMLIFDFTTPLQYVCRTIYVRKLRTNFNDSVNGYTVASELNDPICHSDECQIRIL